MATFYPKNSFSEAELSAKFWQGAAQLAEQFSWGKIAQETAVFTNL